ncbi:MAG: BamA/TamA family outer membrane protein [Balneolaceae bacterium]
MRLVQKIYTLLLIGLLAGALVAEEALAQHFVFGKNRVQYEAFDWRFIQTDHFDIYYYDEKNYHLAQFTAETVESSLQQLMADFGHTLTDRIPVIIYDSHSDFSQTNVVDLPVDAQGIGGVTDKFKNRMTQPFMADYADFRRTLQHELAHAVVNDMYYGGGIQSIMRHNIQLQIPLWFEEGLAEYLALGWDTQTDMYMRDAVINNYLPPLAQLSGFFAYRGGQSFWNFIEEEYGRAKITEILQRVQTTRSVQAAILQSTGLNFKELSTRWMDSLQQRYFPEVAERQSIESIASSVTSPEEFGTYNTSPAISPQGDRIAFISNRRGVFDVVIVNTITGERMKTLIRGEDNPMFEELNILNPNLSWSPDGSRIVLSTKSQGRYNLAIVDYESGDVDHVRFPEIDAINSVAWSPDGQKIAFDGNVGPYQSIFSYHLETGELTNFTNDVFTDIQPAWGPDSETIYFVSNRGDRTTPGRYLSGYSAMADDSFYGKNIYAVRLGESQIERITHTDGWTEIQPAVTRDGRLVYISDKNGIPNIYEHNFEDGTSTPLTDLRTGAMQLSITADGSRIAFSALSDGYLGIYMIRAPFDRRIDQELTTNYWAQRRDRESVEQRVPATAIVKELIRNRSGGNAFLFGDPMEGTIAEDNQVEEVTDDTLDTEEGTGGNAEEIVDFRNYVFAEEVMQDSTLELLDDPRKFQPTGNITEEGNWQPKRYKLRFTPDFTYAAGQIDTYYGGSAFALFELSDLFGDHRLGFGTNLVFDLRNSDYVLQYGYFRQRTNVIFNFFHQSRNYQTYFGEMLRFRTFGGSIDFQYPFNRYERLEYGVSGVGISRDFSSAGAIGESTLLNESTGFLYPQISYTADYALWGNLLTPRSGSRYSVRVSGSPPLFGLDTPQFASILGDYRRYLHIGQTYTLAMRTTGGASVGRDSQTFFIGGMMGWQNQRWSDNEIPFDRLADTFFTLPATPMRGHPYNTLYGDKFGLMNFEFRFPLFAAVLPGPVPILPLYNITGQAFLDAGTAWGFPINYSMAPNQLTGEQIVYHQKPPHLEFRVAKREEVFLDCQTGLPVEGRDPNPDIDVPAYYMDGDILIGAGFGLRTIFLNLPFRYDIGWAYERGEGFVPGPIHYISIGIDF